MMSRKPDHVDSISVFLQGVKRKSRPKDEAGTVTQAPVVILDSLERASGSLQLDELHAAVQEMSMTQLSRFIEQLEEAGLVAVDPTCDKVDLTDMGRSVAKLQHVSSSSEG